MDTHPFQPFSVLPVTTSSLTDVLQTIVALQSCPTSCIPSTSTAMLSPSLPFSTGIPSVNLYPPSTTSTLALQIDSVQSLLSNTSLLQASPSAVEALANALFATTSRRSSCPEPPVTSQATVNLPTDTLQLPTPPERRRYSETNLDVLIREQLAQMMPSTAQLPGMPGCYYQHVPVGIQGGVEQARFAAASVLSNSRRQGQRKARTIYGTTQTQQLEDMFRGQMYVVGAERESLALRLGLSPSQVRIWFQNRRSKHRRKQQEEQHNEKKDEE
ncbi:unnamed protein product [Caenorhabditis sp. 36 PRJEB53466]|nr:unnamed protein product [Caenorhabditis sp. 36 PRJEB53466]